MFPFITTKLLGYLSGGLGAFALAAGAFGAVQTHRLHETQGTVKVLRDSMARADNAFATVVTAANERGEALKARDGIISEQTASIDAIQAQRSADRARYVRSIVAADDGAKVHEARAAELVRQPTVAPADRCEAARTLIIQELQNVR
ncbi:hypothetical protein [Sphingomonas sp. BK580]|uniref:hypothetical protein n=1 Tax=Sphingomonas sp. BK580 TaxID=2586972 RepID=UPI00160BB133|nr:hypothetical protein [Sphingomonas sp. BK580]MBB3693038.1 hypothetical protein [Sphingomonas sp. BK580]